MTAFEGASIKEELAKYGAQGQVQGTVDVEVCSDLATSGHFNIFLSCTKSLLL